MNDKQFQTYSPMLKRIGLLFLTALFIAGFVTACGGGGSNGPSTGTVVVRISGSGA